MWTGMERHWSGDPPPQSYDSPEDSGPLVARQPAIAVTPWTPGHSLSVIPIVNIYSFISRYSRKTLQRKITTQIHVNLLRKKINFIQKLHPPNGLTNNKFKVNFCSTAFYCLFYILTRQNFKRLTLCHFSALIRVKSIQLLCKIKHTLNNYTILSAQSMEIITETFQSLMGVSQATRPLGFNPLCLLSFILKKFIFKYIMYGIQFNAIVWYTVGC